MFRCSVLIKSAFWPGIYLLLFYNLFWAIELFSGLLLSRWPKALCIRLSAFPVKTVPLVKDHVTYLYFCSTSVRNLLLLLPTKIKLQNDIFWSIELLGFHLFAVRKALKPFVSWNQELKKLTTQRWVCEFLISSFL